MSGEPMERPVRVVVCDDQWIVAEGLEAILSADERIEVVALAHDGAEAVEAVAEHQPDLALMDLRMPVMNGIQATETIHRDHPGCKVLVLTTYGADEWVMDAIRAGAAGYLLKGTPRAKLIDAVLGTVAGDTHVDPAVAGRLFDQVASGIRTISESTMLDELSDREREVLSLVARGLTNDQIAGRLSLTHGTVRNYVSQILSKLNVSDRTQAAVLALRYGLVDLRDL